jgi:hypothetical protein
MDPRRKLTKEFLQNLGTTQPHDGISTLPNNQHNPPNESSNENVVELMLLPLNTTPPMKVQTKMSSNLCCCLGEEATLCVPNSSSDIDGWVPPKHELWKAGGGWVWSNVGISRSRVKNERSKRAPIWYEVREWVRVTSVPTQVALVKKTEKKKKGQKTVPYIEARLCAECKLHPRMGPNF